jgi:hypothetical protein
MMYGTVIATFLYHRHKPVADQSVDWTRERITYKNCDMAEEAKWLHT